jgi:hypothetical protein
MSGSFSLVVGKHRAFGALTTINLAGQPERRLTFEEAAILSRALEAVARGRSAERQIYMSPIASDHDFDARIEAKGIVVIHAGFADAFLDWPETLELALALKAASGAGA